MKDSKIPKFRRCVLQNFPFIEEDFDALTDYGLLCKVVEYLNKVIDSQNDVVAKTDGLIESFAQLKSYVDNYFENLDVQDEINNKLEEMAEGGELAGIIAQFLEIAPVFGYGTIAEMAASDNLSNGCIARVLGNTSATDGDGAYYSIRTRIESDDPDGVNLVAIGDTLVGVRIEDKTTEDLEDYINDNYINVKFNGAAGDGVTDDTQTIQDLIDNNPHKTLYFPAGTYLISEPLQIHTGNSYQVNLKLNNNAVITTNEEIAFLLIVGDETPTGINAYDRYAEGSIVTIDGGIFDCGSAGGAIKLTANQKQTKLMNAVIYNVNDYGVYVARGTNTSNSSDADLINLSINGKGSENGGTGIYLYGYDNKLSHIRVNACQIGVEDAGGSYMTDIHVLYSYKTESVTVAEYERTKGFVFSGGGVVMCDKCYADTFANGFEISGAGTAHVYLNNCQAYWYTAVSGAKVNAIKVSRNDQAYKLDIVNFDLSCPNSAYGVDFDGLWLNGKQEYIAVYDFIHIVNLNIGNASTYEAGGVLKKNDWITCRAFYDKDSVQIKDAWATTMVQNSWYPVAYLRGGINQFTLRMANDQIIRVSAGVGQTCTISATNLYNGSHSGEMQIALCNAAQETDRENVWGAILCVRATTNNVGYNPALFDGLNNWNTQIFTRRNFMATTPLVSPTVNASAGFNA